MFKESVEKLEQLGAEITTREIRQQPELWSETLQTYKERESEIQQFLAAIISEHQRIRVIFTGAGTSQYVGDSITPYLKQVNDERVWDFRSVGTTDLVSNPRAYFQADIPTLLVSFARSGNSPESVAAVELAKTIVDELYQLTITCAPDGALAQNAQGDERNLVLLQPERSNDAGFAMTGSYSCMLLTALLTFDPSDLNAKSTWTRLAIDMGQNVINREEEIAAHLSGDFDRVIYLGSGGFAGLARETQLKILELTAGKIATAFDSSLGFRHGPKSFVNETSLAFVYVSNDEYTRAYDLDMLNELASDQIAQKVVAIRVEDNDSLKSESFDFTSDYKGVPDAYLTLPYVVFGQTVSLLAAIKVGNTPDTPSATGTVNRVVKGVIIHPFSK
ncbi:SIS domain-containing protein [Aerococcaceae bacterium zg-ZJ1578]|uniref:SIS domain-containing protein n=1 Tax=Aerococcaceae TaxID=186827 RepID=UPI0013BDF528|nr:MULTISPECIES: SIS domain-containing protein [unclassified Facklamia]MBK0347750.1 SIS domain-containing protein [Aerococcaceae bacterium zg-1578]NEW64143.1 SIS domain-containing protein [Facklamia sp. 252]NEW67600.1 SIS domain-containing protein [Facklamia sp. 253]QQD65849.1 SIS domain-containing protein [Aerococcaceae bacterium zg-252]